jgi:hypothetical protein
MIYVRIVITVHKRFAMFSLNVHFLDVCGSRIAKAGFEVSTTPRYFALRFTRDPGLGGSLSGCMWYVIGCCCHQPRFEKSPNLICITIFDNSRFNYRVGFVIIYDNLQYIGLVELPVRSRVHARCSMYDWDIRIQIEG